jgi:integrase
VGRGLKLTQLQVDKAKTEGVYGDGAGLSLNVTKGGSKSWLFRFMIGGKGHWMGLGPYPTVSIADARSKAADARKAIQEGRNPLEEKRVKQNSMRAAVAKTISFDDAADKFISAKSTGWTDEKQADQWRSSLKTYASPILGNLDVSMIDTSHVMLVLETDNFWNTKTETASRVRGRIESILDWATVRKHRTGENPARWKGHLEHLLAKPRDIAKGENHPALPYNEVGAFTVRLREQNDLPSKLLEFTILTVARASESRLATWAEVDLESRIWIIPACRMKAGKEHRVPLSDRCIEILRQLKETSSDENNFIFPGRKEKPLGRSVFDSLLRNMGRTDITTHGFRSTFRDWAGETTAYPREVIEHAIAHQLKDKAEAAYARGTLFDKRRRLMADWAKHCATVAKAGGVTPIRSSGVA